PTTVRPDARALVDAYPRRSRNRLVGGVGWWRTARRRRRDLERPAVTPQRLARRRWPGTDVETELHAVHDAYDRPLGLLLVPETGHASAALAVRPAAGDLLGEEGAELWIADLGVWLALLAHEPDLAGCSVVVEQGAGPDAEAA